VIPFFFDPPDEELFGIHHPPAAGGARGWGVVLCGPWGYEALVLHRVLFQLATRLAASGFHVLRFDYFGTGDSAGSVEVGELRRWTRDVSRAADELQARAGVRKICLVGARLGAALAARAGAARGDLDGLVLWDPVLRGKDHIEALHTEHRRMLRTAHVVPEDAGAKSGQTELVGFAFPDRLRQELDRLDLFEIPRLPAREVLLVTSASSRSDAPFRERLEALGARVAHRTFPESGVWRWQEDLGRARVPPQLIEGIVHWIEESAP